MFRNVKPLLPAALLALAGLAALLWWFSGDPTADLTIHGPGRDDPRGRKAASARRGPVVRIGEFFERFDGTPAGIEGRWPWFRGPDCDNIAKDGVELAEAWPADGPPALWSVELGEGHAGAAVADGRVYVIDYLEDLQRDALRCFSLEDGREIWRRSYRVPVKRNHGMSRTVPAVAGGYVVTMGPMCHVMCARAATGELVWGLDLVKEYGATVPGWYTGQCPLIEDGKAVLAPAGTNTLLMAVDCATGAIAWRAPNPRGWKMSHSSVTPMLLNGRRTYVYAAAGGVAGVAADGPDAGALLWETAAWSPPVMVPSPAVLDGGRIYLTGGYAAGALMLRVAAGADGAARADEVYRRKPSEGLSCEQQTPLFYEGHLYGIMTRDGGPLRKEFVCYRPDGERVWSSGKTERYGIGPFVAADEKIFILDDEGVMTMIRATAEGYARLGRARVLPGPDSWAPPALVAGRMLVRDSRRMVCLDLRAR